MPFRVLKSSSKARKKPRKRFRYLKARLPKRRKPFFNRDVVAFPSFFGKQRRVRQFYFHPNSAFYG
ncbi:Hypothetical protein FKW44_020586 [Caligus rogercresseyi]|uniref:Uncharacterized protein n=1 Tax=Caligus rogercresseyi TaxID=217165 RepID=A0A7T8JZN4_CALRO|nr:Hypothetical protein FKW44_020586 [Caligus rogercresseyi]